MWRIRFIELLELITLLSGAWQGLRDVAFPDGTTGAELVIILLLLILWEEALRIKRHFKIEPN